MSVRRALQLELPPTEHSRLFGLMSETVLVETNEPSFLDAAEMSFGRYPIPETDRAPLVLRLFRESATVAGPDPVDGRHARAARLTHHLERHLYVVSGSADSATADARLGLGVAFLSDATAADTQLVRYAFVEGLALAMMMYGRGYFTLHASGVARERVGVALCGREGAGKSTLALAAARRGLEVFAEDGVFVRAGPAGLEFWGQPWTQRLVLDARRWFPELDEVQPTDQPNGEVKLEIDLDAHFPGRATPNAHPAALVTLERRPGSKVRLERAPDDAEATSPLWPWGDHWTAEHDAAAELLAEVPQYVLITNGSPDEAIDHLELLLEELSAPAVAR